MVKADGTNLTDDSLVGPVNLFLQSLFSQIDVTVNERLISAFTPTYPYRAMIESLLSYGQDAKASQLSSSLFYKDTAGQMDTADLLAADDAVNKELKARHQYIKGSRVVDMIGPMHGDIFLQDRHVLNGVDLKLKLIHSTMSDGFRGQPYLQGDDSSRVHVYQKSKSELCGHAGSCQSFRKGNCKVPHQTRPFQNDLCTPRQLDTHSGSRFSRTTSDTHCNRLRE